MKKVIPQNRGQLRAQAEATVSQAGDFTDMTSDDAASLAGLIRELRVHQVELEAQNDELIRTQAELTESRDLYCDLFDSAPVGYLTLKSDGKIIAVNLTASNLLRHQQDELVGRCLHSAVSKDDADRLHQLCRNVLSGKPHQTCHLQIPQTDGRFTFLHVQCSLSLGGKGQDPDLRMTLSDVTSLKEAEARRTELEQRLQLKQRLGSLGVLAGGIAHDFNNFLFGIITHADLLTQTEQTPFQRTSVDQIHTAAIQSADLCSQMLDFAGNQQLEKSVFRLSDVVEGMADLLRSTFMTKKVKLNCTHHSDQSWSEGDVTRIRQVVMNIILNAAEAIGVEEGIVCVNTGLVRVDRVDRSLAQGEDELPSGAYVYLEVIDSGCGIEPETLSQVFEPFFTTKFTGRGLGLASVLGIVRSHGGAVRIESVLGSGTTVRVLLPYTAKPVTTNKDVSTSHGRVDGQSTVLLVDDEELVRTAMQAKLQRRGYSVVAAADGAEALEIIKGHVGQVDVVVLDLTMPGISTAVICKSLHKMVPDLPVLLMSGFSKEEALNRCEYTNVAGFVPKPMGDIAEAISEILGPAV